MIAESGFSEKEKVPRKLCCKDFDLKVMRQHVGRHILEQTLVNVCGFCGMQGCSIEFKSSSGRGKTASLSARSNCTYFAIVFF